MEGIYRNFNHVKHDKKEVQHMCKAVEAFAKKESIYSAIESYDIFIGGLMTADIAIICN